VAHSSISTPTTQTSTSTLPSDFASTLARTLAEDPDIEISFIDLEPDDDESETSPSIQQTKPPSQPQQDWSRSLALLADIPLHNHRDRQLYLQPDLIDKFFNQQLSNTTPISRFNVRCTTITPEYFQTHCDQPFMISGIPEHYSWPAKDTWCTPEKFLARHGQVPCKVAELAPLHGMGKPLVIRLPLALYAEYAETCQADFPCYTFERDFNEDNRVLLDDFSVPDYFADDVYALSPELRTSSLCCCWR